MGLLIGVDIGTTKTSAVALGVERAQVLAVETADNPAALPSEADACEEDARALLDNALYLIKRLTGNVSFDARSALAIGVTGQMHGVVLADGDGQPVSPLINWQDQRGNRLYKDQRHTYVEEVVRRIGRTTQRTGCTPATGYGAVTLFRMREEQGLPTGIIALTIHDLLVRTLAGVAVTDATDAASWGIYDVQSGNGWLTEAVEALELPLSLFPEVRPTGSTAGRLESELARELGLPGGLPVAVALGDNQAAFLGSVPSLADSLLLNLGTGGQMSVVVDAYARAAELETRPLVPGRWLLVGASLCGGRAYQILARFFRQVGREVFGVAGDDDPYDVMNSLAAAVDENVDGVRASPLFSGTRADPSQRARITGLSAANFTPGHLARAVIAGMVEELLAYRRVAQEVGANPQVVIGSGNAIRKNPVVRAEIERRAGLPLRLPPHREEAAVGAALTAGVAIGAYPDWQAAGRALYPDRP